jgi:hypothetical protein
MSKQMEREEIFNVLSKNYEAARRQWPHLPQVADSILCPLCRRVFNRTGLEKPAPDQPAPLSFEHSIATAVGGTDATATLVCTDCNNRDGQNLDVHLANRLETEAFLEGRSNKPQKSTLTVGGYVASINWGMRTGERPKIDLRIVKKATRRGNPERIKKELSTKLSHKLKVRFKVCYDQRVSQVAMLRMAFLLTFRKFGYTFVLNQSVTPVLEQILSPSKSVIPDAFCVDFTNPPIQHNTITIVKEPRDLRSLLVVLKMRIQNRVLFKGVILPGPFDTGPTIYQRQHAMRSKGDNFKANSVVDLADYEIDLANPDHLLAIFEIWNEHCGE